MQQATSVGANRLQDKLTALQVKMIEKSPYRLRPDKKTFVRQEASTIKAYVNPPDPRVLASHFFEVPIGRTYFFLVPQVPPLSS